MSKTEHIKDMAEAIKTIIAWKDRAEAAEQKVRELEDDLKRATQNNRIVSMVDKICPEEAKMTEAVLKAVDRAEKAEREAAQLCGLVTGWENREKGREEQRVALEKHRRANCGHDVALFVGEADGTYSCAECGWIEADEKLSAATVLIGEAREALEEIRDKWVPALLRDCLEPDKTDCNAQSIKYRVVVALAKLAPPPGSQD